MTVRYGAEPAEEGVGVRLAVERVTWWQGFHVRSARAEAQVR